MKGQTNQVPVTSIHEHAHSERLSGAQWLLRALEDAGVDTIFGYPGGAIMPVYDALMDSPLRHILTRHEQGAAIAADGYARASGRVGVCMATSGPGGTNLLTGIANAFMDSIPMVAITGQVPTGLIGTDGFQEVDMLGMSMPVVKHSWLVRHAEDVYPTIREAYRLAQSGRPGPVLVDIPKNVAQQVVGNDVWQEKPSAIDADMDKAALASAVSMLEKAQKPVLYVGGGAVLANAQEAVRDFIRATGIPCAATLKGLGSIHPAMPSYLGMLGMHGHVAANMAVHEADLLLVVGARFDDRVTGRLDSFAPHAKVIHLDIDPAEMDKLRHADVRLAGQIEPCLQGLPRELDISAWQAHCDSLKQSYVTPLDAPGDGVYAPALLRQLSEAAPYATVACGVGQHQMWVAQQWQFDDGRKHLTSAGFGTMGYGLPAAVGAQIAHPEGAVICVTGDGSIMMNIQELATLKRYNLPVKILLLDNGHLGMVRQWQELFNQERYSEVELYDNPDFAQVARSFGLEAFSIDKRDQVVPAIARFLAAEGPVLCHVKIDPKTNVWPIVPPGKSSVEMIQENEL